VSRCRQTRQPSKCERDPANAIIFHDNSLHNGERLARCCNRFNLKWLTEGWLVNFDPRRLSKVLKYLKFNELLFRSAEAGSNETQADAKTLLQRDTDIGGIGYSGISHDLGHRRQVKADPHLPTGGPAG